MHIIRFLLCVALVALPLSAFAASDAWQSQVMPHIRDAEIATPRLVIGGLLSEGAAEQFKKAGVTLVIDTRTADEGTIEEAAAFKAVGLSYVTIPMTGPAGEQEIAAMEAALRRYKADAVVLHCHSGGRATDLWQTYQKQRADTQKPCPIC